MTTFRFPRRERELWELFERGRVPAFEEFPGEFAVDMLTRMPSLRWCAHRKVFGREGDRVTGTNRLFSGLDWGAFALERATLPGPAPLEAVLVNYDQEANSLVTRGIRDFVRAVDDGVHLGRFYLQLGGRLRFLGYFSLTRISPPR